MQIRPAPAALSVRIFTNGSRPVLRHKRLPDNPNFRVGLSPMHHSSHRKALRPRILEPMESETADLEWEAPRKIHYSRNTNEAGTNLIGAPELCSIPGFWVILRGLARYVKDPVSRWPSLANHHVLQKSSHLRFDKYCIDFRHAKAGEPWTRVSRQDLPKAKVCIGYAGALVEHHTIFTSCEVTVGSF